MTLKEIGFSLGRYRPAARTSAGYSNNLKVFGYRYEAYPTLQKVNHFARVQSQSDPGHTWSVGIYFEGVPFSNEPTEHGIPVNPTDKGRVDKNSLYYIEPASYNTTKVKIYCACPDSQFSFEYQNYIAGANPDRYGYRPYTRKTVPIPTRPRNPRNPNTAIDPVTGKKGRDFVNPKNYSGHCKHIYSFVNYLISSGLVSMV